MGLVGAPGSPGGRPQGRGGGRPRPGPASRSIRRRCPRALAPTRSRGKPRPVGRNDAASAGGTSAQ